MRNTEKHYTSFADLREDFGLEPIPKRPSNKKKLESIQNKFKKRHVCPLCKQELQHIENTNVMICTNPSCKGLRIKVREMSRDGEDLWGSSSAFHVLDDAGARIANNIFHE